MIVRTQTGIRWAIAIPLALSLVAGCGGSGPQTSGSTATQISSALKAPNPSTGVANETVKPNASITGTTQSSQSTVAPTGAVPASTKPAAGQAEPVKAPAPVLAPATSSAVPPGITALTPTAVSGAIVPVTVMGIGETRSAPPNNPQPTIGPASNMPRGFVNVRRADGSTQELAVEFAENDTNRSTGLMFRQSMPEDSGMLFIFPIDTDGAFWMKNTLLPLSIAFIALDGRIVDIKNMEPQSETLHAPSTKYRFALEMNQGYFTRKRISIGDLVVQRRP